MAPGIRSEVIRPHRQAPPRKPQAVRQAANIRGEVIAVGPGRYQESGDIRKPAIEEGDRVLFGKYAGSEVKIDGVEHIILREDDILAVLED